ncbi:MAG: DUF3105 domain-containing protein [Anaerolineae bacterium]|nr:DUF3105 domain-containing protein [Anaerolineae bacterium]
MSTSKTRQRRELKQAANRSRSLIVIGGVAGVAVVAIIAILAVRSSNLPDVNVSAVADHSVTYPIVGRDHIPQGSPRPDYNSNPPTSGPHYDTPIRSGAYDQEVPDELLVHNLEHGHIWLSYRDTDDTEVKDALRGIQTQFPQWVVTTYRPEDDSRIAVAAWGRLLKLDTVDQDQILAFILRYRNQAPESIPG